MKMSNKRSEGKNILWQSGAWSEVGTEILNKADRRGCDEESKKRSEAKVVWQRGL